MQLLEKPNDDGGIDFTFSFSEEDLIRVADDKGFGSEAINLLSSKKIKDRQLGVYILSRLAADEDKKNDTSFFRKIISRAKKCLQKKS